MISEKSKIFNEVLVDAKHALDSIGIPFHLHSGTALGAHREHDFIQHDDDIDLAVFYEDVNDKSSVDDIIKSMENNGFDLEAKLGKLNRGFELKFTHNIQAVSLDIFWVYPGRYRGKDYYILSSYYGECDNLKHKMCVWAYRPYDTVKIKFLGHTYNVLPKMTLVDAYGKDWKIPKKFNYYEGLEEGYKSLIRDYFKPVPVDNKIAFCFLLYDSVVHGKQWYDFFKQDKFPIKSYSVYSHVKTITNKTQEWIRENHIRAIKTGWCEENLVWAWINLLKQALKDPNNKYFVLLSGECIPLFGFWDTYKEITASKKSRINIDLNSEATIETGLAYADQWILLNRKHAELLVELKTTEKGKEFVKNIRKLIGDFCPDELYPVNWFMENYGKSSFASFKREFNVMPTTYTYWDGKHTSPIRYTSPRMRKDKGKICSSGALFARKFNKKAGIELSGKCDKRKSPRRLSRRSRS
uniref:Uncharacterized protein n=1 Tax=viral metagenome TaxID=1070528 RepID=A0A6C0CZ32_9ZZZZ